MAGIKEIAKRANVSISTASYALNNSPKVKAETKERILAIAKELNYIPNMAGRTLKKQKTDLIGIYLTNYGGAFYGSLMKGITDGLNAEGYDVIICSGEKSHLFVPEKMVDGAIILDSTFPTEEIKNYVDRGHNIVVLDRRIKYKNLCNILLDNKRGSTLAIDLLADDQPEKVYLVTGPKDTYDSEERLKYAIKQLEYLELEYEIISGDFSKESGMKAAEKIYQKGQKNQHVFCLNDEMAIGMYDFFGETDWTIGQEIQLVGFDDTEVSHYVTPRLTTIRYSKEKWGAIAAAKLIAMLKGEKVKNEIIRTHLVRGESVR
ncbi:LacI family DNA-binding transcriptional regulator [uncultured Vagococcus sp.]|uniref:LacI family DNA-binding transcriptional regulator n=1 Tax=uncultured Vagococcus sp. TaxID=189676 RepID=UPI0028D62C36|nr:LacI family DNA-binding transcriptional regulator [uncultured Vagococcus sp.]